MKNAFHWFFFHHSSHQFLCPLIMRMQKTCTAWVTDTMRVGGKHIEPVTKQSLHHCMMQFFSFITMLNSNISIALTQKNKCAILHAQNTTAL
jgi:hypothetical protein